MSMLVDNIRKGAGGFLRSMIGSVGGFAVSRYDYQAYFSTRDVSRSDYQTFDRMRRAKARGFELSGLFLKPMASKVASWVLGAPPEYKFPDRKTEIAVEDWWRRNHADVLRAYEESVNLGDCYAVINADLTVTVVPPHVVKKIVDKKNFSKIIGYKITERYPDPDKPSSIMTITDEYYATHRWHTREINGKQVFRKSYKNLIGINPVVHIKNQLGADEENGRPEGEALVALLQIYNETLVAALKGNIRQGRPTPVIQKMGTASQLKAFWEKFGKTETITLPNGRTETITTIPFDPDQLLTVGGESEFKYEAPGSFSADTVALLQILFYLIVQFSEIPEFIWGNAIGASKASAESQIEPFVKWLGKKRSRAHSWLNSIATIVLAYISLYDDSVNRDSLPSIQWKPLTSADGRLTLDTVIWAWSQNLFDNETAVALLPVGISNPKAVLAKGLAEPRHMQAPVTTDNKSDDTGGKPQ